MPTVESLREQWPLTLPQTLSVAVVTATLLLLAWKNLAWWGSSPAADETSGETTQIIAARPESALPVLLSAKLFGDDSGAATAAGGIGQAQMAASNAGFTLRAAFAAQGGAPGGAIIESSDGTAHWYVLNEAVPGGGMLQEIHRDHVVLNRNGKLERLDFPSMSSVMQSVVAAPASGPSSEVLAPAAGAGAGQPIPANIAPDEKARLIRERLEELRNRSRT